MLREKTQRKETIHSPSGWVSAEWPPASFPSTIIVECCGWMIKTKQNFLFIIYLNSYTCIKSSGWCSSVSDWNLRDKSSLTRRRWSFYFDSPLRRSMVVISFHERFRFLETDVVEASERSAVNIADRVIGHEEMFFPAHKHKVWLF